MGIDAPRLCVQVEPRSGPLDVEVLRGLKGIRRDFGADQGSPVSWGGLKRSVLAHYEKFDEALRADLPLKRNWTVVQEG